MLRRKKFLLIGLLVAIILVGSIGGIVFAQTGNEGGSQPGSLAGTLWERVSQIYQQKTGVALDQQALKDSFAQAQKDIQIEALKNRLQSLVEQGKLTQEQADQYLKWQQSRPDVPVGFGFRGPGGLRGWGGPCMPIR